MPGGMDYLEELEKQVNQLAKDMVNPMEEAKKLTKIQAASNIAAALINQGMSPITSIDTIAKVSVEVVNKIAEAL